jgi:large subunit ribosomal protein L24
MNIRSGDLVEIIVGGDDVVGKKGRVISASPKTGKVIVENLNMVSKHRKPRSAQEQGGIIDMPRPIDVSNVMLVCPKCGKATRVGHTVGENGKFVRSCKKCNEIIDQKAEKKQAKAAAKKKAKLEK